MLETHFVSGTGGKTGREIATPRKDEFHAVALDLFLRTNRHEFIYASSSSLESPPGHPAHLKQNYLIDIITPDVDKTPHIPPPWSTDFLAIFGALRKPVDETHRQVDRRPPGRRAEGVDLDDLD